MVAEELLEVVVLRLLDAVLEDLLEHGVLHLQRRAELEVVGLLRGVQSFEHRFVLARGFEQAAYPSARARFRRAGQTSDCRRLTPSGALWPLGGDPGRP